MKKSIVFTFTVLFITIILAGCSEPKVNDGPPKKAIDTYLEGFRDRNPNKILDTVSYDTYRELQFPGKLEGIFEVQDSQVGKITGWSFVNTPYVDEINNQAIIQTLIKSSKQTFVFEFDVRRVGDKWYIYGVKESSEANKTK